MRIEMTSQPALIGLSTTKPVQSIEQPAPEVNINSELPRVSVESTLPKVRISQTKAFAESGLKGILQLGIENASRAMSKMISDSGRIVDEGNQFADIQNNVDVVAENADQNAFGQFTGELNIVTMPTSGPDIELIKGENNISVKGGTVDINVNVNKPVIDYQRGKLDIYLRQMNSLTISVVGDSFDMRG